MDTAAERDRARRCSPSSMRRACFAPAAWCGVEGRPDAADAIAAEALMDDGRRRFRQACRVAACSSSPASAWRASALRRDARGDLRVAAAARRRLPGRLAMLADPTAPPDAAATPGAGGAHRPAPIAAAAIELCKLAGLLPAAILARSTPAPRPPCHGAVAAVDGLSPPVGGDAAPGERGAGAAGRCRGRAHRGLPPGRRRTGAVRDPGRRARAARRRRWPGCIRNASPAICWARCAATAATSCAAPSAAWRTRVAASCSTWPRKAAASGSPTSCAPTCCRTAGSTRSTPTIISASPTTSATSGPPPRCCASSASSRVRLLTNNPAKIAQLERYGIEVAGRVPHIFAANAHNRGYLLTKAERSGHMLAVEDIAAGQDRHRRPAPERGLTAAVAWR